MSDITVIKVEDKSGLKRFVNVTREIYKDDPNWIQPLMVERLDVLEAKSNPFFDHAEVAYWLAVRDGKDIGRISAQIDELAQENWGPGLGHFGFFEAADAKTAQILLATAQDWLKQRGMVRITGPWSLSVNMEVGNLVDGFDTPPCVMMPHGRPAYDGWLQENGYAKLKDMYAYSIDLSLEMPDRAKRIIKMAEKNKRVTMRPLNMKRFEEEIELIMDIFNEAWEDNWGYVKFTDAEAKHAGKSLKPVVKAYRTYICEYDGEPVAFMLTIPDVNHKIRDLDGKLLPTGIFKLLWRMFNSREDRCRVPLMGVRKKFQRGPLGAAMSMWMINVSRQHVEKRGAYFGELGWILEDNDGMRSILEEIGCELYKTYRIYETTIS